MVTLAAQVLPTGIIAPDYADILQQLRNAFWQIYGSDADLDADSQDGQMLAIFAQAIYDCNQTAVAVYNQFSPATAIGVGLAQVVKINGIQKDVATNSTAVVTLTGQTGRGIIGGQVGDNASLGTKWNLPDIVTFPDSGTIDVTVTCTQQGAITAEPGTLNQILTPTLGWQAATNANAATAGAPVEQDAALRQRQSVSSSLPSQTILEGIYAAVANVTGVQRLQAYQNDTDANSGGLIPHSIAIVVAGGDVNAVAAAIALKKSPGTSTNGTTAILTVDQNGVPDTIKFYELTQVPITVVITIKALTGYVSATGVSLVAALAGFLSTLDIGEDSYLNRLFAPAGLNGDAAISATGLTQQQLDVLAKTYNVTSILQARTGMPAAADVVIAFTEAAVCDPIANVTLVVT